MARRRLPPRRGWQPVSPPRPGRLSTVVDLSRGPAARVLSPSQSESAAAGPGGRSPAAAALRLRVRQGSPRHLLALAG